MGGCKPPRKDAIADSSDVSTPWLTNAASVVVGPVDPGEDRLLRLHAATAATVPAASAAAMVRRMTGLQGE
jgi:hypothetical protein